MGAAVGKTIYILFCIGYLSYFPFRFFVCTTPSDDGKKKTYFLWFERREPINLPTNLLFR